MCINNLIDNLTMTNFYCVCAAGQMMMTVMVMMNNDVTRIRTKNEFP